MPILSSLFTPVLLQQPPTSNLLPPTSYLLPPTRPPTSYQHSFFLSGAVLTMEVNVKEAPLEILDIIIPFIPLVLQFTG